MKRIVTVAIWAAFAGLLLPGTMAQAQTASPGLRVAQAPEPAVTDVSAQRRRPLRRVPIYRQEWVPDVYPRYNPGPNAVRDCTAHLRAGVPAERHGDHPAHELLLAARLDLPALLFDAFPCASRADFAGLMPKL